LPYHSVPGSRTRSTSTAVRGSAGSVRGSEPRPPAQAAPVTVTNNTYYYDSGAFYTKAMHEGEVVYQVVEAPAGAVVPTLPSGCTSVNKGGTAYSQCGTTYYQKVSNGYQVATPK